MSRLPRKKSGSGIYHVMLRGADRRIIFSDEEDCDRFLETIGRVKEISGFKLYAYCLMGNHVHLLLEEANESLETIFKRIGASYVYYYNWKYALHGHLFQDRFRSECVDNDAYFLDVLRYICQNPVKAGLCQTPFDYPWLGCSELTPKKPYLDSIRHLTDAQSNELMDFIMKPCDGEHLEDNAGSRLTDQEAIQAVCEICACKNVQEIGGWDNTRRDNAVKAILNNSSVSIRQLSRLTGISKAIIERISRR